MQHFFKNLKDPISSVRQGAAASLANTVRFEKFAALSNEKTHMEHVLPQIQRLKKLLQLSD